MSRAQWITYAHVPAQTDEAHVQYARGAGEHIAGNVDVAPGEAKWPVAWNER